MHHTLKLINHIYIIYNHFNSLSSPKKTNCCLAAYSILLKMKGMIKIIALFMRRATAVVVIVLTTW